MCHSVCVGCSRGFYEHLLMSIPILLCVIPLVVHLRHKHIRADTSSPQLWHTPYLVIPCFSFLVNSLFGTLTIGTLTLSFSGTLTLLLRNANLRHWSEQYLDVALIASYSLLQCMHLAIVLLNFARFIACRAFCGFVLWLKGWIKGYCYAVSCNI